MQLLVTIKHPEFTCCFHQGGDMNDSIFQLAQLKEIIKFVY